jgi:hypothetical protein
MAEYSTPAHTIGHGSLLGTRTVASPAPRTTVGDSDIQTFLQQQISRRSIPRPTPNTLYFVYLPRGTAVTMGGGRSCQAFCGYHDHIGGTVFYAVLPYPGCAGCAGGLKAFDAATSTSSHELCEAITDPVPGSGWYDDNAGEIGDVCAWSTRKIGKYTIQKEWSNQSGGCQ